MHLSTNFTDLELTNFLTRYNYGIMMGTWFNDDDYGGVDYISEDDIQNGNTSWTNLKIMRNLLHTRKHRIACILGCSLGVSNI